MTMLPPVVTHNGNLATLHNPFARRTKVFECVNCKGLFDKRRSKAQDMTECQDTGGRGSKAMTVRTTCSGFRFSTLQDPLLR